LIQAKSAGRSSTVASENTRVTPRPIDKLRSFNRNQVFAKLIFLYAKLLKDERKLGEAGRGSRRARV
jgi:hypothetical protein